MAKLKRGAQAVCSSGLSEGHMLHAKLEDFFVGAAHDALAVALFAVELVLIGVFLILGGHQANHPGKEALGYRVLAVREFIEQMGIKR